MASLRNDVTVLDNKITDLKKTTWQRTTNEVIKWVIVILLGQTALMITVIPYIVFVLK